jgi:hypothetical protein
VAADHGSARGAGARGGGAFSGRLSPKKIHPSPISVFRQIAGLRQ